MRVVKLLPVLLAIAACSKAPTTDDASSMEQGPGVNVTAAPGVAFTYRYAFRLPAAHIAGAQEGHAQACERLGVAQCRISGMTYSVADAGDVSASLAFKLAPALARAFAREGIASIARADGMMVHAEIEGTDAGAVIDAATSEQAAVDQERRAVDGAIARARTSQGRDALQADRQALTTRRVEQQAVIGAARAALASTPVSFSYATGPAVHGFDARSPIVRAGQTFMGSLQTTLSVTMLALAAVTPPALALLLLWLLWLHVGRRLWSRLRPPPA